LNDSSEQDMTRAISLAAALAGCSLPALDPEPRDCPCVDGYYCRIESKQCIEAGPAPTDGLGCVVYIDSKLYCANRIGIEMFAQPAPSGPVINHLLTSYSWFTCWDDGEMHAGGNTSWYFTDGDDRGQPYGWLPAADVRSPQAFNADPAAYGFPRCATR
jgi:hypothetical protein